MGTQKQIFVERQLDYHAYLQWQKFPRDIIYTTEREAANLISSEHGTEMISPRRASFFLLASWLGQRSWCLSTGAPDMGCVTMTPGHGPVPQTRGTEPARATVDKNAVKPGEKVKVRVESKDGSPFKVCLNK